MAPRSQPSSDLAAPAHRLSFDHEYDLVSDQREQHKEEQASEDARVSSWPPHPHNVPAEATVGADQFTDDGSHQRQSDTATKGGDEPWDDAGNRDFVHAVRASCASDRSWRNRQSNCFRHVENEDEQHDGKGHHHLGKRLMPNQRINMEASATRGRPHHEGIDDLRSTPITRERDANRRSDGRTQEKSEQGFRNDG